MACAALPVDAAKTVAAATVSAQTGRRVDAAALGRQTDALARRIVREVGVTGMAVSLVYRGEVVLERGYGVVEARRAEPVTATVPFVFITSSTDLGDSRVGYMLGADDYIHKPLVGDDLLALVTRRLGRTAA